MDIADSEACYRAVKSRDRRFDGVFYTGVTSTGIYCRPSCPALTPQRRNVTFHRTAAAAQAAGFRACKRCLPDATPGSPDWDVAADVAGRSMRLIADGVVEREGVPGLAGRLGYSPRHLNRLLLAELGAGPLALARARRAQTARVLVETTTMTFTDVAFASGFSSVRQFNETVREVYAGSPTELRGRSRLGAATAPAPTAGTTAEGDAEGDAAGGSGGRPAGQLDLRLAVRLPFAAAELLRFLAVHAVAGVEQAGAGWYARTLALPHGDGRVRLELDEHVSASGQVRCRLEVADLRDVSAAVERCRRLLDADADVVVVEDELAADPLMARLVRARPGLRVPGQVDGQETAVRTVVGQQVSVQAATTVTGRLVEQHGRDLSFGGGEGPSRVFPDTAVLAALDPVTLPMVRARGRALVGLCAALAEGTVPLDRSLDRDEVRRRMLGLTGIGPWTADYVAMRALGHPDVFLPTDIGVRNALRGLGEPADRIAARAEGWRPWRSYALMHLWSTLEMLRPADRERKEP